MQTEAQKSGVLQSIIRNLIKNRLVLQCYGCSPCPTLFFIYRPPSVILSILTRRSVEQGSVSTCYYITTRIIRAAMK